MKLHDRNEHGNCALWLIVILLFMILVALGTLITLQTLDPCDGFLDDCTKVEVPRDF